MENVFSIYYLANCIRMRRDKEKKFKGSIYVEMSSVDECKKLLDEELKYSGEVLSEKSFLYIIIIII